MKFAKTYFALIIYISIQGDKNYRIRKEVKDSLDASADYANILETNIELTSLMKSIEGELLKLMVQQVKYFQTYASK